MKIAVVTPISVNGERGGAENLYEGLLNALKKAGHSATQIKIPVDESSFENILEAYCQCYYLNLDDYDCVISTKAPTYMVRHKNHISYLLHTIRVFYDMFDAELSISDNKEKEKNRKIILAFDQYGLSPDRIKKHCTIGQTVVDRIKESSSFWENVNFEIVYPATRLSEFNNPERGQYIFLPGRLHRWKRIDLVINAMKFVEPSVKLIIVGTGEDEEILKSLVKKLKLEDRVIFLGKVSDDELLDLYSKAIAVPFVPLHEDYGYVTIEAFKSKKPVVTCYDSGEPALIVKDGISGFIVEPDPLIIADKINYFIKNPEKMSQMGNAGFKSVNDITWDNVISKLLDGIKEQTKIKKNHNKINVLITDMQPIDPAVGGGRIRLKGLYSNLGDQIDPLYIGTYDWKGEKKRDIQISSSLREKDIPLSADHFKLNEYFNNLLPGKTIIDSIFPFLGEASPDFISKVREEAEKRDVIVISHPWMYPLLKTELDLKNKILIYDSQNCEYLLRKQILGNSSFSKCIVNLVKFTEKELCESADMVLACSEEDKNNFCKIYDISPGKVEIFPNGVDTDETKPATSEEKRKAKEYLKISTPTAIFMGSDYPPNLEAANYIADTLADQCPNVTFFIVGSVGNKIKKQNKSNVLVSGFIDNNEKQIYLAAADIAINPMMSGSGTNIKMFDFLAAGLPTISTPVGARGIENPESFLIAEKENFAEVIRNTLSCKSLCEKLSENGRSLVKSKYDWNKISQRLGNLVNDVYLERLPFFSVIIPTYRSNDYLIKLFEKLNLQSCKDFEVIVVDSGEIDHGDEYQNICNFKIKYLFRPDIGAAKARNVGIENAEGKYVAFTDDDCQPDFDWLNNAKKRLDNTNLCGLEGLVYTDEDKINDPKYRIVTNKGFEGIGFITANLIVSTDVLKDIGGFDVRFDKPHFREDTDLGWRAQEYGLIPYAKDVRVYHPPLPRVLKGESTDDRDYFFINDAILFSKFPKKYIQLMKAEGHYKNKKNFWKYFIQGCEKCNFNVRIDLMLKDGEISTYVPAILKKEKI